MNNIIEELIHEAFNHNIIIDGKNNYIAFNTIINGNELINGDKYPTLVINDYDELIKKLDLYIRTYLKNTSTLPLFQKEKEKNLIKYLVSHIFIYAENKDFKNPIELIETKINFLNDNTFKDYNKTFEGFISNTKLNIKSTNDEITLKKMYINLSNNDDIFNFPTITYAISNEECYIYKIEEYELTNSSFEKKVLKELTQINKNINKELLTCSPQTLVSILIFIKLLKDNNIKKLQVVTYLPVKYNMCNFKINDLKKELKQLENKTGFYKKTFKRINKQTHMINEELETYIYDENITNSLLNTIINSLH